MNILIPMAGEGSRFKISGYEKPKPLIPVLGVPMIEHALNSIDLDGNYIFVIREYSSKFENEQLESCLRKIKPDCHIIKTKTLTRGSAETCLLAEKYINNEQPLLIANCDQFLSWDSNCFLKFLENEGSGYDSVIITYNSKDEKNSFAKIDLDNNVLKVDEKKAISDIALIGVHYWKKGEYFIKSAKRMIEDNCLINGEFYVAPTLNYLISSKKKVGAYHLEKNVYHSLGTPSDLKLYIGKANEYKPNKAKTILCDIDGTIFKHAHRYSNISLNEVELNEKVQEKFDQWDSLGLKIILLTGRKESARPITVKQLELLGIPYDQLIMNVGNGPRVLINDKLNTSSPDRAISVNVEIDNGFDMNWEKIGL